MSLVNAGQFLSVGCCSRSSAPRSRLPGMLVAGVRVYSPADFRLGIALLFACTLAGLIFSFFIRERAPATRAIGPRQQ